MDKDKTYITAGEKINEVVFTYVPPKVLWTVQIPANGELHVNYTKNINWWVRMWMRFIGWKVTKVG